MRDHHDGVHVGCGAGGAAVGQERASGDGAACCQERTEVGAGDDAEALNRTHFTLVHRLLLTVASHGHEVGQVTEVGFHVGVDEHQVAGFNGLGVEVHRRGQLLGHQLRVGAFQLTGGLTQLVQGDGGVDSGTHGAVGKNHVGAATDHTVRDQLFDGGHVLADQLDHVAGDVILVHGFGFARQLHQHTVLLQGDLHVLVCDAARAGRDAFLQQVVAGGDVGCTVGASINREGASKNDRIRFVLRDRLLSTEGGQHFDGHGVLEHFALGHDEVPTGNKGIGLHD